MTPSRASTKPSLTAACASAFESALEAVPFLIVAGLVAFSPVGEKVSGLGVAAAFAGAALAQLCVVALARTQGLIIAGPSLGLALILAGALAALQARGLLGTGDAGLALATVMALTLLSGICLALVTALGVGRLAAIVPYPVLAGLRNGTALLLLLEQGDAVLGLPHGSHFQGTLHLGAAVVAAVTVAAMLVRLPALRNVPPVVRGLVAGIVAHHLMALVPGGEALIGPVMSAPVPQVGDFLAGWKALEQVPLLATSAAPILVTTVASMTLLMLLETVAARSALNTSAGLRGGAQPDLAAMSITNMIGGAMGTLPTSGSLEETVPAAHVPLRRAPRTLLLRALALAVLAALLLPLLGRMPGAVLAGVIIVAALEVLDLASLRQIATVARRGRAQRIDGLGNLLIVAVVATAAVAANLAAAVLVGTLLALVVFVADMSRGPVRRRYRNPIGRSRTRRDEDASEMLLQDGLAIEVIELQGALFFASVDQVAGVLEEALAASTRHVVLDMRHVHRMDLSAAQGLIAACERMWQAGHRVTLSAMHPGAPAWDYMHDRGLLVRLPATQVFATLEDALEAAEDALLAEGGRAAGPSGLSPAAALASLAIPEDSVPGLLARMIEQDFPAGTTIIHAGETSRGMFVLLEGRAEVMLKLSHDRGGPGGSAAARARPGEWRVRVATLGPGTLFGEMALLTGRPRSADLVAHGDVRCLRLDPEGLDAMRAEAPEAAWQLLRAVAVQIELNLRLANAAIASYEE